MNPTTDFFAQPQPAAVLKHGILTRYLPPFAFKVGSAAPGGRVAYLDGYAGPGRYDDGSPGSPALAIALAETMAKASAAGKNRIDGYFVEMDGEACGALREYFEGKAINWPVFEGNVQDHLAEITESIDERTPLFAFLDPFGVNIPLDMISKHLLSRSGKLRGGYRVAGAATEVLLNFSMSGIRRSAGHLTSEKDYAARQAFVDKLDGMLGGESWHEIWRSGAPDRAEQIRAGYVDRIIELHSDWTVYSVDVRDRLGGPIDYWLLLLTQHEDGAWLFNEAVSGAMEDHRAACIELTGQPELESDEMRAERWINEIAMNIESLLDHIGTFRIGARLGEVYGSTLGYARAKHVRKAVRHLNKAGVTPSAATGDVQGMTVYRGRRS